LSGRDINNIVLGADLEPSCVKGKVDVREVGVACRISIAFFNAIADTDKVVKLTNEAIVVEFGHVDIR